MGKIAKEYLDKLVEEKVLGKNVHGNLSTYFVLRTWENFNNFFVRLARGLTIDEYGNIVLVGFPKFFNEFQLEGSEKYNEKFKDEFSRLQPLEKYECFEKMDGSMVIVGEYNNSLVSTTRRSSNSDVCISATNYLKNLLGNKLQDFISFLKEKNVCYVFEYVGKCNLIGVHYDFVERLVLLGAVDKNTLQDVQVENIFNFPVPRVYYKTREELNFDIAYKENFEGYVIKNSYGNRIKVKTDWWFTNKVSDLCFTRGITKKMISQVLECYFEATEDDLLSKLHGNTKAVEKVNLILETLKDYYAQAIRVADRYNSVRDIAVNVKDTKVRDLAISVKLRRIEAVKKLLTKILIVELCK